MDNNLRFWQRVAKLYTPLQEKNDRELYGEVAKLCEKYLSAATELLELACGTGQLTFLLCDKVKRWEATDFSEKMVREVEKRNAKNVLFSVKDATALTYEDGSFDAVLIANALHVMPSPEKALSEIRRVLKTGGVLLCPTFLYEGKINKVRLKFLKAVGFKTYHKWTLSAFTAFLEKEGFEVCESVLIKGKLLPEGFVACKKKKKN